MDNRKRSKRCSVCGDSAVGFNFGAIACESCKAFFRRTARKAEVTSCVFNEQCVIGVTTRRFCSHCRLKKCFTVGMKTSLILDEKARRDRREKITRNRLTRFALLQRGNASQKQPESVATVSPSGDLFSTSLCDQIELGLTTEPDQTTIADALDGSLSPHYGQSQTRMSLQYTSDQWRSFLESSSDAKSSNVSEINDTFCCRNSLSTTSPFSHNSSDLTHDPHNDSLTHNLLTLPPDPHLENMHTSFPHARMNEDMARLLSHYQWTAINDLRNAYDTNFVQDESCSNLKRPDLTLSSLINTSRFLVRRLINFAKTLSDFSQLKQDCQISLLKGVVLSTLFLLSARHYDVEKDVWVTPKGEVSTQILRVATGMDKFYEEHTKYCRDFNALVARDSNLVALMQVLCLFTPDRPALDARQTVANVHDRYYLLLKHYLEAKVGFAAGRKFLVAVLSNLGQLEALTMNYGHMLMQLDPTKVDPLLMEIFNLTPPNNMTGMR